MPVILTTPAEVDRWLEAETPDALALQRPLPDGALRIVATGKKAGRLDRLGMLTGVQLPERLPLSFGLAEIAPSSCLGPMLGSRPIDNIIAVLSMANVRAHGAGGEVRIERRPRL
jgi:hypothetical protein